MSQKFYGFQAPQSVKNFIPPIEGSILFSQPKTSASIKLPKLKTLDGKEIDPVRKEVKIRRLADYKYRENIFGNGISNWNSASSLRISVPHFSVSKGDRFLDPATIPPAPNKYGSIGLSTLTEKSDFILMKKRKHIFQEE